MAYTMDSSGSKYGYSPEEYQMLNELLSKSTMRSDGTINGQPNATLSALMNPPPQEPPMSQQQLASLQSDNTEPGVFYGSGTANQQPKNYFRNNSTGVVTSMDDSVMGGRQRALDYSSGPVEYGGQKGYRVKGDPFTIEMQDGTLVKTGQDVAATRARQKEDLALEKTRAEIAQLKAKPTKVDETPEQKNYRFAMTLPEAMREPFLEKLGMSRKPEKDADAKRAAQMEGIGDVISQAKAILTNKAPGQVTAPTQSGLGSIADTAAGWFGMAPPGSEEADKLRVLGGVLTSKMPRMEGPQSEYDVKLYQEMAGRVGDSSVPVSRRVKALEQVQSLWKKYDKSGEGQVGADTPTTQAPRYKLKSPGLDPKLKSSYVEY